MNLLDLLIAIPGIGFILTLLIPRKQDQTIRMATLGISLVTFVLSLGPSDRGTKPASQEPAVRHRTPSGLSNPEIHWQVGIDGLSLWLIILSTFLTPIAILISWQRYVKDRTKRVLRFPPCCLESGLVGVFAACETCFCSYVFWEVVLVPMCFLIGILGTRPAHLRFAVKFFLYTFAGSSVLMLVVDYLPLQSRGHIRLRGHSKRPGSGKIILTHGEETLLFLAFFVAFAIKVPLFPLHTWLPDAHVEAPSAGSLMLASVMLKMGTYGLVRFCLPMFPTAARENASWIVILAIIGIVYGALVAMVQPNMKKLVAYSSVSHLGFVVLGIFSFTQMGLDGAVYQMLNHGISTGALFVLVGFMYERRHSLAIADYGGVATAAPWLSTIFLITTLASIGLPMLNNFVGEFLVLQGTAQANFTWTIFAAIGVILSACYMLWMYQRVFFGELSDEVKHHMPDFNGREWACMIPLVVMMVWMGIYTQTFLPAVTEANLKILDQSKSNVPLRVSLPGTSPATGGQNHAR